MLESHKVQMIASVTALVLLCGSSYLLWRSSTMVKATASKSKSDLATALISDVIDDVRLLGTVRYSNDDGRKLLEKKYFIDLVALVTFHVRSEFREERGELLKQRRDLFE